MVIIYFMCLCLIITTVGAKVNSEPSKPPINTEASNLNQENVKPALNSRPFNQRNRKHLENTLQLTQTRDEKKTLLETQILHQLSEIYNNAIKPMEDAYKFTDISSFTVTEGDIMELPKITFIGPWSTGKSSMINYLLGVEDHVNSLPSGATPTTTDFTIIKYDTDFKTVDGMVLAIENSYSPLKKYGHTFLDKLSGLRYPSDILQKVTIIDTPGITENLKQRNKHYPFNEVCQWFLSHSEMIVVVFDPSKLDVGQELENLFHQLKGYESKVRFVLNKADTLSNQELMRVYGALFWNLAPVINMTEPPRVYVGSFWSKSYHPESSENYNFFKAEETSLFKDLHEEIANWVETKIIALRQHALYVRNHALTVDQFLKVLNQNNGIFKNTREVANKISEDPHNHHIMEHVIAIHKAKIHDFLPLDSYTKFFSIYEMDSFLPVAKQCSFFGSCYLDAINNAINKELPNLLFQYEAARGILTRCNKDDKGKCQV